MGQLTGDGKLAENLLHFCRTLRRAGLPIGPGQVIDALRSVLATGIDDRRSLQAGLRAVLIRDPSQIRLFDQAFHIYFRNPRLLEKLMDFLLPTIETEPDSPAELVRRLEEALGQGQASGNEVAIEIDRSGTASRQEVLQSRDFEQMSLAELAEARELLRKQLLSLPKAPTRRFHPAAAGERYDLRRALRLYTRHNSELAALPRRARRWRERDLVILCDISGSMSGYSRMFMQFAHLLGNAGKRIYTFVFGTRLTNVSRWLKDSDIDAALAALAEQVPDWDGGTRIAGCLEQFNRQWSRRVLAGRSLVLLLSDGLERDSVDNLAFQAARLRRSCDELLWLNPMLRFDGFEPRARGVRALLPHVDRMLPGHNVESLTSLASALHAPGYRGKAA